MSPLHCNTVQEALWERAGSTGPASLSPAMADHLAACPACQSERRSVGELLEASDRIGDPPPPQDLWDEFDAELEARLDGAEGQKARPESAWSRWGRRGGMLAAMLVVGFGLGLVAMRSLDSDREARLAAREDLLTELRAEIRNDARLESYLHEIEQLLVSYRAAEHGDAVEVFRRSLPSGMVAGPGVPTEADRIRLEQRRVAREQLRTVVLGMLASEIESERRGFDYLDRRIAEIAGQRLLYFVH